jgi:hypothetical protein
MLPRSVSIAIARTVLRSMIPGSGDYTTCDNSDPWHPGRRLVAMTSQARADPVAARSEEWQAARGVLIAITAGTGAMLTLIGLVAGSLPLIALPTAVLIGGTWGRWSDRVIGWAGMAIWVTIVPLAHAEGILAPLVMVLAWLAVAIGPDPLGDWLRAEWSGRDVAPPQSHGWIEDDLSVR